MFQNGLSKVPKNSFWWVNYFFSYRNQKCLISILSFHRFCSLSSQYLDSYRTSSGLNYHWHCNHYYFRLTLFLNKFCIDFIISENYCQSIISCIEVIFDSSSWRYVFILNDRLRMSIIGNLRVTWSIGLSAKRFIGIETVDISENLTDLTQSLALELWSLRWQNWNRLFRIRNRIKPHQSIISLQRYNRSCWTALNLVVQIKTMESVVPYINQWNKKQAGWKENKAHPNFLQV